MALPGSHCRCRMVTANVGTAWDASHLGLMAETRVANNGKDIRMRLDCV
jgi:hypothetical protein